MDEQNGNAFIGLDVGGTSLAAGLTTATGELIGQAREAKSPSSQPLKEALATFAGTLLEMQQNAAALGMTASACGVAMPAPFDYRNGVSRMKHKFESLYGYNLRTPLEQQLGIPVFFINDADAFGLGVSSREYPHEKRVLCITLGTGIGSAFVVDGDIINNTAKGVPKGGEIWNLPYKDGILEDKISKEWLTTTYEALGGAKGASVKHIVERARAGDSAAVAAAQAYARELGEGLATVSALFHPTIIVFGGKISSGLDVFAAGFEASFKKHHGSAVPFRRTRLAHAAVSGAGRYAAQRSAELKADVA